MRDRKSRSSLLSTAFGLRIFFVNLFIPSQTENKNQLRDLQRAPHTMLDKSLVSPTFTPLSHLSAAKKAQFCSDKQTAGYLEQKTSKSNAATKNALP